jgi:hypothetical protein
MTALQRITETPPVIPEHALIDKRTGKPKRVPRKVANAIRLIETGEVTTIKAAAERVGLSREHLSISLGKPHIQVFLAQRARQTIGAGVLRAAVRAVELIDASSEHVSLDASRGVLAIEGIKPAEASQVSVNVNVSPGYVIDLSNGPERGSDKPSSLIEG